MTDLSYLMEEICCGLEIYFSSRTGGQFRKTAYILCDDYTELTSKLFLLDDNAAWSEKRANNSFKSYPEVLDDVGTVATTKLPAAATRIGEIHDRMKARRIRRNQFFHATHLLDLSVNARGCIEAYRDLLDYGEILFGTQWTDVLKATRAMEAMRILLQLDMAAFTDESVPTKINGVLARWPRNVTSGKTQGIQVALHPDDLHLRMSLTWGGADLRDALSRLLP